MNQFGHDVYLSPFTWRYGSAELRQIWSETNRRRMMRQVWVALATAQAELGLVSQAQLADLKAHVNDVDIERAAEIEAETRHDIMAEIRTYAEQCKVGGGIIHLGATSEDVSSNVDPLRIRESLDIIIGKVTALINILAVQTEQWADLPTMAFTHIQPAEPTTVGYRLAQYLQDLNEDLEELKSVRQNIRGKGFKGAVGNSASYVSLFGHEGAEKMEKIALQTLGLEAFQAATQVYPRKQDAKVLNALANLAASLYRLTFDLRLLQTPPIGEMREPFGKKQVGSSAMPFKRNPISAEKVASLSRYLSSLPNIAWQNAAGSILERTLDDSANRRITLPSGFLCADELVKTVTKIVENWTVDKDAIARNMRIYGPFSATEKVLMEAAKAGGDRQQLHEIIREHCLKAWAEMTDSHNPLAEQLANDTVLLNLLGDAETIHALMDATEHTGLAPQRAKAIAHAIRT